MSAKQTTKVCRSLLLLLVMVGLVSFSGANCPNMVRQATAPLPRQLPPSPTLEQVIEVVNNNNSQIHSFSTTRATLSGPGFPTLRADVAYQRDKRFRLRAGTGITGPEVDLGSNEREFWFWIKRNQPPAVYHCRHDQFAFSSARQMMPIDPVWLIEALGTAEFDPALPHQGPFVLAGNRLEVRTVRETPDGPTTKSTILDEAQGHILEQHIYNARGQLVASSITSGHRRDPLTNLTMPTVAHVHFPPAQLSLKIDLGNVRINRLSGNPEELWSVPQYQGSPLVDLGNPAGGHAVPPSAMSPPPALSSRPREYSRQWQRRVY